LLVAITLTLGIPLSRGGSAETVLRAAVRCEPIYVAICQTVAQSAWVVPNETGWRVGGHAAWLHTLVGPEATAYAFASAFPAETRLSRILGNISTRVPSGNLPKSVENKLDILHRPCDTCHLGRWR
jgi:transposase